MGDLFFHSLFFLGLYSKKMFYNTIYVSGNSLLLLLSIYSVHITIVGLTVKLTTKLVKFSNKFIRSLKFLNTEAID